MSQFANGNFSPPFSAQQPQQLDWLEAPYRASSSSILRTAHPMTNLETVSHLGAYLISLFFVSSVLVSFVTSSLLRKLAAHQAFTFMSSIVYLVHHHLHSLPLFGVFITLFLLLALSTQTFCKTILRTNYSVSHSHSYFTSCVAGWVISIAYKRVASATAFTPDHAWSSLHRSANIPRFLQTKSLTAVRVTYPGRTS